MRGVTLEFVKRFMDLTASVAALCLLSPVLILIAAGVKADSKGNVIFRQTRCGKDGRLFTILKFRTMRTDAENGGPRLAVPGDKRVTRFGRFLRRYHLDELPQLWNVAKGDMSLVGPRPERPFYVERILAVCPEYRRLFDVRPGLTSPGAVRHGYASDVDALIERSRHDLRYVAERSILADIAVLASTVRTVIEGKGI